METDKLLLLLFLTYFYYNWLFIIQFFQLYPGLVLTMVPCFSRLTMVDFGLSMVADHG